MGVEFLGVNCPGCLVELTTQNVGGYRCFCADCVDKFPEFPDDGRGYVIGMDSTGFYWQAV